MQEHRHITENLAAHAIGGVTAPAVAAGEQQIHITFNCSDLGCGATGKRNAGGDIGGHVVHRDRGDARAAHQDDGERNSDELGDSCGRTPVSKPPVPCGRRELEGSVAVDRAGGVRHSHDLSGRPGFVAGERMRG